MLLYQHDDEDHVRRLFNEHGSLREPVTQHYVKQHLFLLELDAGGTLGEVTSRAITALREPSR
ncbi:hypothetical protein [Kitasatospora sp. NPDC051914]|uniref:hypothetical protein n=1 Tax=Kitasatospora sp. NPDC051914 TaxID=3154945 RepID=UPI0034247131